MWWCGVVGDEAKEFVNYCVVSVTRFLPPTPISMASHVSIWPALLGKEDRPQKYCHWLTADNWISPEFPNEMRWIRPISPITWIKICTSLVHIYAVDNQSLEKRLLKNHEITQVPDAKLREPKICKITPKSPCQLPFSHKMSPALYGVPSHLTTILTYKSPRFPPS